MAGSVYTFKGVEPGRNDGAITTSQGTIQLGQSGLFLPSEVQSAANAGIILVLGPATSPWRSLTAPTLAAGSSGTPDGVYLYAVTFTTAAGETRPGPEASFTLTNQQGSLSQISVGTLTSGVLQRKIYRTVAGGSQLKLLTTIADNTTTTFTDDVADGSLGADAPTTDTAGVVSSGGSISPSTVFAELTGNPSDDDEAIGAGTGRKIAVGGSIPDDVVTDDAVSPISIDSTGMATGQSLIRDSSGKLVPGDAAAGDDVARTTDGSPSLGLDPSLSTDGAAWVTDLASSSVKPAVLLAPPPTADLTGFDGEAYTDVSVGAGLELEDGTLSLTPSGDFPGVWGDASDGALVFDGSASFAGIATKSGSTYTLTRPVFALTVEVQAGVTLKTAGFPVFATTSITVDATGAIDDSGANATSLTGATGTNNGLYAGGGSGGLGTTTAGGVAGGSGSSVGTGASGAGGNGASGTGAVGTSNGTSLVWVWRLLGPLRSGTFWFNNASKVVGGTKGGGGGAGDGTHSGGGGGASGGIIALLAPVIVNNGSITANGGNGFTPTTGNCGGGGPGAGGAIVRVTKGAATSGSGTTSVASGTPGSGVGTGTAGAAGSNGTVTNIVL